MNEVLKYLTALVGGLGGFLGGAWIIAQAVQKTASNPVYDTKFAYGEKTMDELKANIDQLKQEVREVRHGQNNLRSVVQAMADKVENFPEMVLRQIRAKE